MGICDGMAFEILPVKTTAERITDCVIALAKESEEHKSNVQRYWRWYQNEQETSRMLREKNAASVKRFIIVNAAWAILLTSVVACMWG